MENDTYKFIQQESDTYRCSHEHLDRVIKQIGDHTLTEDYWACSQCGEEFTILGSSKETDEDFVHHGTVTGRLSSSHPNLSNPPCDCISGVNFASNEADTVFSITTTDEDKIKRFLSMGDVLSFLYDFENWIRQQWKYEEIKYTDDQHKTLEEIRNMWYQFKEENNVDLD